MERDHPVSKAETRRRDWLLERKRIDSMTAAELEAAGMGMTKEEHDKWLAAHEPNNDA